MKLLKKLHNSGKRAKKSTTNKSAKVKVSEANCSLVNIVVAEPNLDGFNLIRHFAIENRFQSIIYIDFSEKSYNKSLACSLHGIEEFMIGDVKSLGTNVDIDKTILLVVSCESLKWLESVMFLRRNYSDVNVYFSGSQKFILGEEKILSKYRENFSGVIMKKGNHYDREYSQSLIIKKIQKLPVIFLSDGVMKAASRVEVQAA